MKFNLILYTQHFLFICLGVISLSCLPAPNPKLALGVMSNPKYYTPKHFQRLGVSDKISSPAPNMHLNLGVRHIFIIPKPNPLLNLGVSELKSFTTPKRHKAEGKPLEYNHKNHKKGLCHMLSHCISLIPYRIYFFQNLPFLSLLSPSASSAFKELPVSASNFFKSSFASLESLSGVCTTSVT